MQFRDFPMPHRLADSARAWLSAEGNRPEPMPAKPSATVMLLRETTAAGGSAAKAPSPSSASPVCAVRHSSAPPAARRCRA